MFALFTRQKHQSPSVVGYKIFQQNHYQNIYYDPNLIASLKEGNQKLLQLYIKISYANERKNFRLVEKLITTLSSQLRKHLLKENSKLYLYLRYTLEDDPEGTEIFKRFEKEIRLTGRVLNDFVSRYSQPFDSSQQKANFSTELVSIGYVLTQRIDNEERFLYPLYKP